MNSDLADCVSIIIPRQRTLSQPIAFGLVVPNATPKITCAREHPKSVSFPEHFYGLMILRAYDQYALFSARVDTPFLGPGV